MRLLCLTFSAALVLLASSAVLAQTTEDPFGGKPIKVAALGQDAEFVEVEIIIAEWGKQAVDAKDIPDPPKLEGSSEEVAKQVRELERSGRLSEVQRIRLVTADGHTATTQVGGDQPRVTGMQSSGRGGGGFGASISYQSTGTMISLSPKSISGSKIAVELTISKSGLVTPADSPILGQNESGKPTRADSVRTFTLRTVAVAPSGQTVAVSGWEGSQDGCLVLLSAKTILSEPKDVQSEPKK